MFSSGNSRPPPASAIIHSLGVFDYVSSPEVAEKCVGRRKEGAWDKQSFQDVSCLRKVERASGTVLKEMSPFSEKLNF